MITSQHRNRPKYISWASALLSKVDDAVNVANSIPSAFDIDNAVGAQLDIDGQIIGRSRYLPFQLPDGTSPMLDDQNYRIALKAKIAMNQWDGTVPRVYEIWKQLFPDATLIITDNQDMSMKATIQGSLGLQSVYLVTLGYIIPKPSGVRLDVAWDSELTRQDYLGMLVTARDTVQVTFPNP
nr:DUF2612 domain-containing protein [Brevibacillus sp. HD1.4A]